MDKKEMINWCSENLSREDWGNPCLLPDDCGWSFIDIYIARDCNDRPILQGIDRHCIFFENIFTDEEPQKLVNAGYAGVVQPTYIDGAEYLISFEGRKERAKYKLSTNTFYLNDKTKHCDIPASIVDTAGLWFACDEHDKDFEKPINPKTLEAIKNRDKPRSVYDHEILPGIFVDVYDVSNAFKPKSEQVNHALKKVLAAGDRGHKDYKKDIKEAIWSLECELNRLEMWGDDNE